MWTKLVRLAYTIGVRNRGQHMINLTDKAKVEIKRLISQQGKAGQFLRMGVKGGGCSGFTYDVKIDESLGEFDREFSYGDFKVVTDVKSLLYLDNMTVDFSTELVNGGFRFINPNASGSCGCGTSFSVEKGQGKNEVHH